MCNLPAKPSVEHHKHLKLLDVVDQNFAKAIWKYMSSGFNVSVADFGHLYLALEAPSDSVVDTMRLPPVRL